MDQRTEKLCCTGNLHCMYSMSNIACLKKMGSADGQWNDKYQAFAWLWVLVLISSQIPPSPPATTFLLQGAELLVFLKASHLLTYSQIPLQITGLFIIIHAQNLYLSHLLLLWQRVPLLSNSFELISESKFGHQICNKGTVSCDEDDGAT